ncbi:hypothetical protein [Pseudomonas tohonis]|uniref:hypothetical protein n=1 Tax=Pseudomonas tohonis TaxID=2725477 RepID=UPI001F1D9918|nr:hypothetical protein [Pseudomonas tohonis]
MIEAIEAVLKHWGEAVLCGVPSGGLGSTAGTLVEWKGCPPRTGAAGSRMLLAGAGPDYLVSEVSAALAAVERAEGGELLRRLAYRRYTFEPALSVAEQVSDLDLGRGDAGRRAYTRAVERLHKLLEAELLARMAERKAVLGKAKREGDRLRKLATKREPDTWVREAGERFRRDRSSGDSAPVGAVAPRQAPVRNNR